MMIKTYIKLILFYLSILFLTACNANLIKPQLYKKSPEIIPVVNEAELKSTSYIARYLMDADDREKMVANIRKEELERTPTGGSTAIALAGTTLIGNNPFSASGVDAAGKIFLAAETANIVLDILGPDGNLAMVSKIYLPSEMNGIALSSAEKASDFARAYTQRKVEAFAHQENRTFECIYGCGGESASVYRLIKIGFTGDEYYDAMRQGTEAEGEYYDPPSLYMVTIGSEIIPASVDIIRDRILGYTPKWESKFENGWHTYIAGDIFKNKKGEVQTIENKNLGTIPKGWNYNTEYSPVARRFFRLLTGGDNLIYRGRDIIFGRQVAFQGKVYEFTSRLPDYFLKHEVAPESDFYSK